jgi:hypothetical protein
MSMSKPLLYTTLALLLSACSSLPDPNPSMAWIDLSTRPDSTLSATSVDGYPWTPRDYFEVSPGSHTLTVDFDYTAQDSNIEDPSLQECTFELSYDHFRADHKYLLVSGWYQNGGWLRLLDEKGNELAYQTCGAF